MYKLNRLPLWAVAFVSALLVGTAQAELTQISVGGQIRIRGEMWRNSFYPGTDPANISPVVRIPAAVLSGRPTGDRRLGENIVSFFKWGEDGADVAFFQQRTVLNFRADFTDNVSAFIELENWGVWGDDSFRSNYFTGADFPGAADSAKVDLYQAYIEAREMWGTPLQLRVGRQELVFGSGWLVGNNTNFSEFRGLFFDAVRLTYDHDVFSVDAFWSKLDDRTAVLGDNQDADFMGVYASYTGLEDIVFDAYWFFLRDSIDLSDTRGGPFAEWREDFFGLDDYDTTNLHTVGLRAAGVISAFDFEVEAAYQFGDADAVGIRFQRNGYGDDGAEFDAFGANAEIGYTFDTKVTPRLSLHAAYLDGEDNRDLSYWEWASPFSRPQSSISFNRLFSNKVYSYFLDENSYLSNVWLIGGGVQLNPTESVTLEAKVTYFEALEEFDLPVNTRIFGRRVFYGGPFSFWTQQAETSLGVDAGISLAYQYNEDLVFRAGWSHFFLGEGLEDGNFVDLNGLLLNGASDDRKDADYFFFETELNF